MVEYKQNFAKYDSLAEKDKSKIPFEEIYVVVSKTIFGREIKETMLLKDLLVKKKVKGKDEYVPLNSKKDYDDNLLNGDIFYKEKDTGNISKVSTATLMFKPVLVPSVHTSTTLNKTAATESDKVAFGLKRDLEVKEVATGECVYCKIADKWTFAEKSKIYWYEGTTEKTFEDFKRLTDEQKKNVRLFYEKQEISEIYTEYEYDFTKVKAKEEVDIHSGKKKTYSKAEDGTYSYSSENLNVSISSQTFQTQTVDDKDVSVVKAVNYTAVPEGIKSATANNVPTFVKLDELATDEGKVVGSLTDLRNLLNENRKVKRINKITAIDFESANEKFFGIKVNGQVSYVKLADLTDEKGHAISNITALNTLISEKKQIKYQDNVVEEVKTNITKGSVVTVESDNKKINVKLEDLKTIDANDINLSTLKSINVKLVRYLQELDNVELYSEGEYVSITVNNQTKMVSLNEIVDIDGNPINSYEELKKLIGQKVCVKSGDTIVATSEPLTFEQANITYNTVKTYQRVQGDATEDTCLRLEDGEYVKELETVQPISYKIATGEDFDKYLVKKAGEDGRFVIVDKAYFEANGKNSEFDTSKVLKLQRCDFKDKDCSIVQTTSNNQEIENCDAVKDVTVDGIAVHKQSKDVAYNSFLESYKAGNYKLNDFYVNGKMRTIQKNSGRYEYTDEAYHEDWAENLHQYQSLKTSDLKLKDGKVEGGAKFDFKKALKKSFGVWGVATFAAVTVVPFAGIFVTALAPVVSIYAMGCLAAAPLIPIVNGVIAFARREKTHFKDKTQYNRKKLAKQTTKELDDLYQRTDLNEKQFEDAYSRIMNKIAMLSQTTSNNSLTLVNGTASVNSNNINLAHAYKDKINKASMLSELCDKKVEAAQAEYDKLMAEASKSVDAVIPANLQSKLDKAKKELDELLEEQKELKNNYDSACNTTIGENYSASPALNLLERKAQALKLMKYVKQYPDNLIVSTLSDELKNKLTLNRSKDNLFIDGVSIFSDEDVIKKQSEEWKNLREEALKALNDVDTIQPEKPSNGNVKEEISRVKTTAELEVELDKLLEEIKKVESGISEYVSEENRSELLEELEEIKESLNLGGIADLDIEDIEKIKELLDAKNIGLEKLQEKVLKVVEEQNKDKKKQQNKSKADEVRRQGEKMVQQTIEKLLDDKSTWTKDEQHIFDALLTTTALTEKDLKTKLKAVLKKLTTCIDEGKNAKFTKGSMPYTIVNLIAEKLNLGELMHKADPNQISLF